LRFSGATEIGPFRSFSPLTRRQFFYPIGGRGRGRGRGRRRRGQLVEEKDVGRQSRCYSSLYCITTYYYLLPPTYHFKASPLSLSPSLDGIISFSTVQKDSATRKGERE
jgi:hypothetical protein